MAVPADDALKTLLDRYVCVRLVQMHGVDLKRFSFDGSLTWAIFMMNADGTIYGRYGSRSGLRDLSDREISLTGFKASLRGGLEMHGRYGQDKDAVGKALAGKTSSRTPKWRTPEAMPTLKDNARFNVPFLDESGVRAGCIHCHMVPANEIRSLRLTNQPIPDRELVPYPMPNQLGFRMDPKEMATVLNVGPRSVAGRAGLQKGDRIDAMAGQPILSTADIQWVLHNAGDPAVVEMRIVRGDEAKTLRLTLAKGWRMRLPDWRFINKGLLRQALGFNVDMVPRRRARRMGLGGKLALTVDKTSRETRMKTGLGNKDLIIAVDGKRGPMTVGAFTAYVLREKKKGDKLTVRIMELVDRFPRPEHDVEVTIK
ncbi:MAG: hypothetical protein CMJ83_09795 [Planctomycetes bacterium]|nr:hypothetical protein [Planctomycetota bacterium]